MYASGRSLTPKMGNPMNECDRPNLSNEERLRLKIITAKPARRYEPERRRSEFTLARCLPWHGRPAGSEVAAQCSARGIAGPLMGGADSRMGVADARRRVVHTVGSHIAPLGSHTIQRFIQLHDETILLSYPSGSTMTVIGGMPSWSRA